MTGQRVLVIYTGGTIGMQSSAEGYNPIGGLGPRVVERLDAAATGQLPAFEFIELATLIDSANLVPDDWNRIVAQLHNHWDNYDGFVILHGTDTMAYTASALSFMLGRIDKPVIVTGSQIPLSEARNDALDNLITSLVLAANTAINEVCISFGGRLLRGNRARKMKSTGLDAFDSPNSPWLGRVGIHIELQHSLLLPAGKPCFLQPQFDPQAVTLLQLYPGIPAQVVDYVLDGPVRAVIVQSYGVGNPPSNAPALLRSFERAAEDGVMLLNLTQCPQGCVYQGAYATGSFFNRIGVVPGSDLTLEAAFAKLMVMFGEGQGVDSIRKQITMPIAGECMG